MCVASSDDHRLLQEIHEKISLLPIRALRLFMESALDPWDRMSSEMTQDVSNDLKKACLQAYQIPPDCCMLLGRIPRGGGRIQTAHIWPRASMGLLGAFSLQPGNVDDPRNFLRLHHEIERAFDRHKLTFVWDDNALSGRGGYVCQVLDSSILQQSINDGFTFANVDGRVLRFGRSGVQPFSRLLGAHLYTSLIFAKRHSWIPHHDLTADKTSAEELIRFVIGCEYHVC